MPTGNPSTWPTPYPVSRPKSCPVIRAVITALCYPVAAWRLSRRIEWDDDGYMTGFRADVGG